MIVSAELTPNRAFRVRFLASKALLTLSATQRAVLVLRYYEDLADADIAAIMGCRRATVRSHAARGLAALRLSGAMQAPATEGKTRS